MHTKSRVSSPTTAVGFAPTGGVGQNRSLGCVGATSGIPFRPYPRGDRVALGRGESRGASGRGRSDCHEPRERGRTLKIKPRCKQMNAALNETGHVPSVSGSTILDFSIYSDIYQTTASRQCRERVVNWGTRRRSDRPVSVPFPSSLVFRGSHKRKDLLGTDSRETGAHRTGRLGGRSCDRN